MKPTLLIALIVALLTPFSAQAEGYLQLKMGLWEPIPGTMTSTDDFAMVNGQSHLERGVQFGISGGGQWGMFGVQGETGYQWFPAPYFTITNIPLVAMARFRVPVGMVAPYVEGGGGMLYMSSVNDLMGSRQRETLPTFGGGIGIDLITEDSLMWGLELRYMYVKPVNLSWGTNSVTTVDMSSLVFSVNVGWTL